MLEVLEFIFRDFWTWAGTAFLLGEFLSCLVAVFAAVFDKSHENCKGKQDEGVDEDGRKKM